MSMLTLTDTARASITKLTDRFPSSRKMNVVPPNNWRTSYCDGSPTDHVNVSRTQHSSNIAVVHAHSAGEELAIQLVDSNGKVSCKGITGGDQVMLTRLVEWVHDGCFKRRDFRWTADGAPHDTLGDHCWCCERYGQSCNEHSMTLHTILIVLRTFIPKNYFVEMRLYQIMGEGLNVILRKGSGVSMAGPSRAQAPA